MTAYAIQNGGFGGAICTSGSSLSVFGQDLHANQANGSVGSRVCLWEVIWHAYIKFGLFARPGLLRAHGGAQDQRRFRRSGLIGLDLHQTRADGAVSTHGWLFTHVGSYCVRIYKLCAILTGMFWLSDACADLRQQLAMVSAGA